MTPKRASPPAVRLMLVALAVLMGFSVLALRLIQWQVLERRPLLEQLGPQPVNSQQRARERGSIVDRNGQLLAIDTYTWEIVVEPSLVAAKDADHLADQLIQTLGADSSLPPEEVRRVLHSRQKDRVTLAKAAPQAVGELVRSWDDPAIGAWPAPVRYYPQRSLAAHLLGFVNLRGPYYGVEQYYDDYLRAVDAPFARSNPAMAATYAELPSAWQQYLPSISGQDLVLTIDSRIQYMVERALAEALGKYRAESGTIIVMEPKTGAILAMASLPAYDPNRHGNTKDTILADPTISKQYEPGSVFKIVTMSAGIDAGLITPDSIITDTAELEIGGRTIQNWDKKGHGPVSVTHVLVNSLNVGSAEVALLLQESLFYQYVRRFGFGQPSEVDLVNEAPGTVKVPGDPFWSKSDLATNAFGQGIAVTPLQMTSAAAVIANGGMLPKPHVVQNMILQGRVLQPNTASIRRVIKPETAAAMTDMMVQVVDESATQARVPGYTIAGKTGTAQVAIGASYHPTLTIASFIGFAPAYDPKFVCLVKLDTPKANPWALGTAVPVFAEVAKQLFQIMHIPPDRVAREP